ncbi:MAG: AAA family ATPase [Aquificae bacterium]|nr:AAA family ATPase [Aquificota bacterium]
MKLIGHEHAKDLILGFLEKNYDSYSFIFEGKNCIGKKLISLYTARGFLCDKKTGFGCGECNSCRLVNNTIENIYENQDKNPHPNIKVILPQDNKTIKIDQIREAIKFLRLTSEKGKVLIIDEAEKMNVEASNALLKTLEEPPQNSMLILITSNHNKLLPTIVSRCKKIRFKPLTDEDIRQILDLKGFPHTKIEKAVKISDGSLCLPIGIMENEKIYNYSKDLFNLLVLYIEKKEIHSEGIISLSQLIDNLDNESIFNIISILETFFLKKRNIDPIFYENLLKELDKLKTSILKGVKKKLAFEGFYFNLVR